MNDKQMSWEEAVQWLKEQPDQQALVHDAYYDDPLLAAAKRYHGSGEWQALRQYFPASKGEALDLGAGRGITAYALASEGWQTTALEPDASPLVGAAAIRSLAQESGLAIAVVEEWGESLPFADNAFALVHCRAVLHHARDLKDLCREIHRVLQPGGLMIATREHVISRHADLERFFDLHPLHHLYGGEYAYLLSEYTEAITSAGLQIEQTLNPYASPINLFPQTLADIKQRLAKKLHCPAWLLPDWLIHRLGDRIQFPGRLYSFIARKPG